MFGCIGVCLSTNPARKTIDFHWFGESLYQDLTDPQIGPTVLFEYVGVNEV